ncbi:hypothetical protein S40288_01325 [Stachybotrys chartarum IBT 40288]|nr:hypothetical protein S40288_01325 [Stachybotrys chartarum IBT 40288]
MASIEPVAKSEKKHKKEKSSKSEKKRVREEDGVEGDRKHKKSKSTVVPPPLPEKPLLEVDLPQGESEALLGDDLPAERKKRKHKKRDVEDADAQLKAEKKKQKKKSKDSQVNSSTPAANDKEERKKKTKRDAETPVEEPAPADVADDQDAMDIDLPDVPTKSSRVYQPPDIPTDPQFPFFTQTVSLYEPIYPMGWAQPVTSAQSQHLRHLLNRYVPHLRGVLIDYKNVALGEFPGRQGAATDDEQPTVLVSKNEAAVGFGWITADVDLFVPSRGAWMEGSVNLQTEGHIGVVCFGKFNASIEARRLPSNWKWIPNEAPEAQGFEETASVITADDHGVVRQIHSTGFWSDERGDRVKGKIRFRIRNYDVGTSGDTSYLSLEGTMLDKKDEKKLVEEEARTAKLRKAKKSGNQERRTVPEFSMTRFAAEEPNEAEQAAEAAETTRSSRVGSEV